MGISVISGSATAANIPVCQAWPWSLALETSLCVHSCQRIIRVLVFHWTRHRLSPGFYPLSFSSGGTWLTSLQLRFEFALIFSNSPDFLIIFSNYWNVPESPGTSTFFLMFAFYAHCLGVNKSCFMPCLLCLIPISWNFRIINEVIHFSWYSIKLHFIQL